MGFREDRGFVRAFIGAVAVHDREARFRELDNLNGLDGRGLDASLVICNKKKGLAVRLAGDGSLKMPSTRWRNGN